MKKIFILLIVIACVYFAACGEKTAEAVKKVGTATTELATTATAEATSKIKAEAAKATDKAAKTASDKLHEVADRIRK